MNFRTGKIVILILLVLFLFLIIFDYFNHTYIKAEFTKTGPMPSKMGVYYKGYRLGSTNKLKISKDFKTSYLYITLNQRGLQLPKNIKVEVKNYDDETKYVDIIYPSAPMIRYIRTGDVIKGVSSFSFDGISDVNQAHLDDLSEKGGYLLNSATKATDSLTELFDLIFDILDENRENILNSSTSLKFSMENLEATTLNLRDLSDKINNEVDKGMINSTLSNLELTTQNLSNSSKEFITMSGNFNKTSSEFTVLVPKLSILIDAVQLVVCNVNEIVIGLKNTLMQRFGGVKIFFGKPINGRGK
ncbi:hypothetical protein IJ541_06355 [bacterium]|nr:hypothetical protein [bacterium]